MTTTRKTLLILASIIVGIPALVLFYFLKIDNYEISRLLNYDPAVSTQVYDRNGIKIANIFDKKHRYYATMDEIPAQVVEALLAIEDTRFFEHDGINIEAIFRAIIKDVAAGKMAEGASTITQQLVKNKLLTRDKKISRKIKEIIYSIKLEKNLTKEEILERYLNEIYFGHGYYGIKTAAEGYFRKNLRDLTLKEIAILVGLPKAPSIYAPTKNYEMSMGRANRVVTRLFSLGWIDEKSYKAALEENPAVYDETLTQNSAPFVADEVAKIALELGIDDIRTGGYQVYTTIDSKLQAAAEKSMNRAHDMALERSLTEKQKKDGVTVETLRKDSKLNGALVSVESATGDVIAFVGSIDYDKSQFNRATQGQRQVGSAFKPFIYQIALDRGYTPSSQVMDIAQTYTYMENGKEVVWQPKNYKDDFKGAVSLRDALVHSRNLATLSLVNEIGLNNIVEEVGKFGIKNIQKNLSVALGAVNMSPMQLAQNFVSFANGGVWVKTNLINRIEKRSKILYAKQIKSKIVTDPLKAYAMTTMLKGVVDYGTGTQARLPGIDIAGKTGTTNSNVDGWFVGFSPAVETVVWFGNDDNTPMRHSETGGRIAAPAFALYYQQLFGIWGNSPRKFVVPEGAYVPEAAPSPAPSGEIEAEESLVF